jgi:hypothetical protein
MSRTRNNKMNKKNKTLKVIGGETDLSLKYSLESIDEDKNSWFNTVIGFVGVGTLWYFTFYKNKNK